MAKLGGWRVALYRVVNKSGVYRLVDPNSIRVQPIVNRTGIAMSNATICEACQSEIPLNTGFQCLQCKHQFCDNCNRHPKKSGCKRHRNRRKHLAKIWAVVQNQYNTDEVRSRVSGALSDPNSQLSKALAELIGKPSRSFVTVSLPEWAKT